MMDDEDDEDEDEDEDEENRANGSSSSSSSTGGLATATRRRSAVGTVGEEEAGAEEERSVAEGGGRAGCPRFRPAPKESNLSAS